MLEPRLLLSAAVEDLAGVLSAPLAEADAVQSEPLTVEPATGDPNDIQVVPDYSQPDRPRVQYLLPELQLEQYSSDGQSELLTHLTMGGAPLMGSAGQPLLPFVTGCIAIPNGYLFDQVQVTPGQETTVPGSYLVEPAAEAAELDGAATFDAEVYEASDPFPGSLYDVVGTQYRRGVQTVVVNLHPVQYAPDAGTLSFYDSMTLDVQTVEEGTQPPGEGASIRYRPDTIRPIADQVDNPLVLDTYSQAGAYDGVPLGICDPAETYEYVVVTTQGMVDASTDYTINDFAAHKTARGLSTTIVTVGEIYSNYSGVDQAEQLRNFVIDAYNNWETDYVLLGGDSNLVPYRYLYTEGYSLASDLYYQCLDGTFNSDGDSRWGEPNDGPGGSDVDLMAEVYVGRASAENTTEMANWVYKTTTYEQNMGADHRRNAMMVGEHLGFGGDSEYAKNSMEEIRLGTDAHGYTTAGFAADPQFTTDTLYEADGSWSRNDLMNIMNSGTYGIFNHLGHANSDYVMHLYNSHVDSLTNDNFFFIYSQGCHPGKFTTNCIAEHFTTSTRSGAFAVVMNYHYGWGRYNSTDGPSQRPNRQFWDALFAEDIDQLGAMNADSHEDNIWCINDNYIRWVVYETNLFGDPHVSVGLGLTVTGSVPSSGEIVDTPPTDFTVMFSHPYDAATVDPGDLTVNGIGADSVTLVDDMTATFHYASSPVTAQGLQTMEMSEGAVSGTQEGDVLRSWSDTFRYDALPMVVVSTTPPDGSTVPTPMTSLTFEFNEAYDPSSISLDDLQLDVGQVVGVNFVGPQTLEFVLEDVVGEGPLNVTLPDGAIADDVGNPMLAYAGSYQLDIGTMPYPTPLEAKPPSGSLVYDPSLSGAVSFAGDTDSFTLDLESAQTLTVVAVGDASLQASVALYNPMDMLVDSASAGAAGEAALLQTAPVATAGTYTVVVSGAGGSTGSYTLQAVLNAAVEEESYGGASNDALGGAQYIDGAFATLYGVMERGAVLGVADDVNVNLSQTHNDIWYPDTFTFAFDVSGLPLPAGDADLDIAALADFGNSSEYVTLDFEGIYSETVFATGGGEETECHTELSISRSDLATMAADGTVTIVATPSSSVDDLEPPESYLTLTLKYSVAGPSDYYEFSMDAGDRSTILVAPTGDGATELKLYDGAGDLVTVGLVEGDQASIHDFVAPARGYYYAEVAGKGAYNLVVTRGGDFDAEPNDELGQAQDITLSGKVLGGNGSGGGVEPIEVETEPNDDGVSGGSMGDLELANDWSGSFEHVGGDDYRATLSGSIDAGNDGDWDFFKFRASPGDRLVLEMTGVGLGDTYLRLFDRSANQIAADDDGGPGVDSRIDWDSFTYAGDYYAVADSYGSGTGSYSLTGTLTTTEPDWPGTAGTDDYYSFAVNAGDAVHVRTATPGDAAGEFINNMDPVIELYDPTGSLVFMNDNGTPDGRNAELTHVSGLTGTYTVRVFSASDEMHGEYLLTVDGYTGTVPPFQVTATDPADGVLLGYPSPPTMTVDFSAPVTMSSVDPGDLTVDGMPATGVTPLDPDTAVFDLPLLSHGPHNFAIAAGAITSIRGVPVEAYGGSFDLDLVAPRVIDSSVQGGDVLPTGSLTYTAQFDEELLADVIGVEDVELTGPGGQEFTPDAVAYDAGTSTLSVDFPALPEGDYTLVLLSGTGRLQDLVGNALDANSVTWPIPPNVSGDGVPGGNLHVPFELDVVTAAYPTPLEGVLPHGSCIYDPAQDGRISFVGDTDAYTLDLADGQNLSLVVTPDAGLTPTVELRDPSDAVLGSATAAAAGETVMLQTVPMVGAGTYTIVVGEAGGVTGYYTLEAVLNAAVEFEGEDPPDDGGDDGGDGDDGDTPPPPPPPPGALSNDDLPSAQNIEGSFIDVMDDAERGAVVGVLPAQGEGVTLYSQDCEMGILPPPPTWTAYSESGGQVRVTNSYTAAGGQYAVWMDAPGGVPALNELIWQVDLSAVNEAKLHFSHAEYDDEESHFSGDFTGHYYADGVAVSDDGTNWHPIWNAANQASGEWHRYTFDLAAAADDAGMDLNATFRIKFQQYDDYALTTDGRGYDEFVITTPPPPAEDWYAFDLDASQHATLAATSLDDGDVSFELYDAGGSLLASSSDAGASVDEAIVDFEAPADGTYAVRMLGFGEYSFVAVRSGTFERETGEAIPLGPTGIAVGDLTRGMGGAADLKMGIVQDAYPWGKVANDNIAKELGYSVTIIPSGSLGSVNLYDYDVMVMAGDQSTSTYSNVEGAMSAVESYVAAGGVWVVNYAASYVDRPYGYDLLPGADGLSVTGWTGTDVNVLAPDSGLITGAGGTITDSNLDGGNDSVHGYTASDMPAGGTAILSTGNADHVVAFDYPFQSGNVMVHTFPVEYYNGGPHGIGEVFHRNLFDFAASMSQDDDEYLVDVSDGDILEISTATPGDAAGMEFVNEVDPMVELLDADGNVVASDDNGAPDGRNARMYYVVPAGEGGTYTLRVLSVSGSGEYALRARTGTAPRVTGVQVAGTGWTQAFLDHLASQGLGDGGYRVPAGGSQQMLPMPWTNVNQIRFVFDEDVSVEQGDLEVFGVNEATYAFEAFSYDAASHAATWTFRDDLSPDKLLAALSPDVSDAWGVALDGEWTNGDSSYPSGDGLPGGDFSFRLDVLPGDVDQSGYVNILDTIGVRNRQFQNAGDAMYSRMHDVDGNAAVNILDTIKVRNRQFTTLPDGEPEPLVVETTATFSALREPLAAETTSETDASTATTSPEPSATDPVEASKPAEPTGLSAPPPLPAALGVPTLGAPAAQRPEQPPTASTATDAPTTVPAWAHGRDHNRSEGEELGEQEDILAGLEPVL
jgi:hypothetical protein